ncbi:MAG: hypothetical protein WB806_08950 [Xanthobacteraceae bacterium]
MNNKAEKAGSRLRALTIGLVIFTLLSPVAARAADAIASDKVSFYFAAHEDDWQLFMNPNAFEDVLGRAAKTVFVHVTAGDDGLGTGNGGRKYPYYLARENGAVNAMRFMADADRAPIADSAGPMLFNGHPIYRVAYRNTIGYFLRLPDGNALGEGFAGTGFQSLKHLAGGDTASLAAVDGSTTYQGWSDLVATVREIIKYERGRAPLVQLNVADPDSRFNPADHSDHLMTAKAALDAAVDMDCVRRAFFVDYASSKLPANLTARERDMESAVFAVTLAGVIAFDQSTAWQHYDQSFIGRNYFRVEEPTGRCRAAPAVVAAQP